MQHTKNLIVALNHEAALPRTECDATSGRFSVHKISAPMRAEIPRGTVVLFHQPMQLQQ